MRRVHLYLTLCCCCSICQKGQNSFKDKDALWRPKILVLYLISYARQILQSARLRHFCTILKCIAFRLRGNYCALHVRKAIPTLHNKIQRRQASGKLYTKACFGVTLNIYLPVPQEKVYLRFLKPCKKLTGRLIFNASQPSKILASIEVLLIKAVLFIKFLKITTDYTYSQAYIFQFCNLTKIVFKITPNEN